MNIKSAIAICLFFFTSFVAGATIYYSQVTGTFNTLSNWNTNRLGGGTSPSNFNTAGDIFIVQGTGNGGTSPHTMTVTGASITFNGASEKVQIESGGNMICSNSITMGATSTLQVDAGGTFTWNNTGGYANPFAGIEAFDPASNFEIQTSSTTGPTTASVTGNFGNVIYNASTTLQCNDVFPDIAGNLTISGTGEFRLAGSVVAGGSVLNIAGNLFISSGIMSFGNGTVAGTVNLGGNFNMSGGTLMQAVTGGVSGSPKVCTFNFNKSGVQNFIKTAGVITSQTSSFRELNFYVLSGSTLDMSTNILNCLNTSSIGFTVNNGAAIKLGDPGGIVASGTNAITGNIQTSSTSIRNFDSGGSYEYNGSVAQVTGTGLPASVKTLTLNNSSFETITLTNSVNIDDSLSLQKGFLLTTSAIILNLRDTTVIGSVNSNFNTFGSVNNIGWERSFVKGPVKIDLSSTADKWIPVGKITGTDTLFAPVKLAKANSNPVADTIEYFPTPYIDTAADAGTIRKVSYVEYWKINANSAISADVNAKITLSWRPKSGVGNGIPANDAQALDDLVIAHYLDADGPGGLPYLWYIEGGDVAVMPKGTGSTVNYGIVNTNLFNTPYTATSTLPYFTLASRSLFNILPLKLLSFSGYASARAITLNWKTAEEKNVANFELQKSTDGIHFYPLTTTPAFNSIGVNTYSETDINPVNGFNYYRLRIKDNTQKITYSPVTKIKFENQAVIHLYPNPVKDKLTLNHDKAGNFTFVKIVSVSGTEMFTQKIIVGQQQSVLDLNNLPGGWYILKFINGNNIINKAFYKQ